MDQSYKVSAHSVYNLNYHIVFCPKYRRPVLVEDIVLDINKMFTEIITNLNCVLEKISVEPDHIHLFISARPNISPHFIVKNLKGLTAAYLRNKYPQLKRLPTLWSRSYYVGSVGFVSETVVKNYIDNQKRRKK